MTTSLAPTCDSCGMPMRTDGEHALSDPARPYCRHCGRDDGERKSYDEVLGGMTAFLQRTQGLDRKVAREAAKAMMAKLPAWSGR